MKLPKFTIKMIQIGSLLSALGIGFYAVIRPLYILPFFLGVLIGLVVSILRVVLLAKSAEKSLNFENPKRAGLSMQLSSVFRYFILVAVLIFVGINQHIVNFWGVIYSVLAFQISIYLSNITFRRG
ncbi:MAG: ATP synthase subunit I [Defluviitaleaceae bacterium]|nr:ATP synthase subunit I [Defluviitaleaceae bacterium]